MERHETNNSTVLADKGGLEDHRIQVLQSKSTLKWRVGFSLLALSIGAFFGLTAVMYPRRIVNRLIFNSQTNMLSLSTNTPLGGIHLSKVMNAYIIVL